MRKVVFISCGKKKLSHKAKAKDLYIGSYFKLNLMFARTLKPDNIFILSAKHGLVGLEQELDPYEQTLNKMSANEIKRWAENVKEQMENEIDFEKDEAVFLAGEKYRKYLLPLFRYSDIPNKGRPIGKQLQYLKNKVIYAK